MADDPTATEAVPVPSVERAPPGSRETARRGAVDWRAGLCRGLAVEAEPEQSRVRIGAGWRLAAG